MDAWGKDKGAEKILMLGDGNGDFTDKMNMLVEKFGAGFGYRSWRYAMIVVNGIIKEMFIEPGKGDGVKEDPYGESSPENVLKYIQKHTSILLDK